MKLLSGIFTDSIRINRNSMSSFFVGIFLFPGFLSFGVVSEGELFTFGSFPFRFRLIHPNRYPFSERRKKSPGKSRGLFPTAFFAIGIARFFTFFAWIVAPNSWTLAIVRISAGAPSRPSPPAPNPLPPWIPICSFISFSFSNSALIRSSSGVMVSFTIIRSTSYTD